MSKDRMTTADIAALLELKQRYVTNKLVKRADFPPPVLALSQKTVQWARSAVLAWVEDQRVKALRRSARR